MRELRIEENVHAGSRRRRFAIAPEALLRAQKAARAAGLAVIGYYHSHPDAAAVPSAADLSAAWPEVSYLIVELGPEGVGGLRSWRLDRASGAWVEEQVEYEAS